MADDEEPKVNLEPNDSKLDDDDFGSSVDGPATFTHRETMNIESPSSELEKLSGDISESDNDSMKSGSNGMYTVNPTENEEDSKGIDDGISSPTSSWETNDTNVSSETKEPVEKKPKTDRRLTDSFLMKKGSGDADPRLNESLPGSRPGSAASSSKSGATSKDKDPIRKEKEKEREDRIRIAQLRLAEERQRKIEEMREQQRLAQENREKQLEARRRKIDELKRREEERRKQVEERRLNQEISDRAKKEAILNKAKERLTRYEQWKSHGRKGRGRHVLGFGSRTPREVCLPLDSRRSSSQSTLRRSPNSSDYDSYFNRRAVSASSVVRRHCCIDINKLTQGTGYPPGYSPPSKKLSVSTSVLYHKRSPDFSSTGAINTAGTGGLKSGAESMIALHAIPENRLGRSFVASAPPSRHKSSVNLGSGITGVKMRDPSKMSPRKPRPSSVATSMPSFVRMETDTPKSSRSKSTDRGPRERSKTRTPGSKDDDKADGKDKKAATLPRPYDRKKIEERRQEVKKKAEEKREKEIEKMERMSKSEIHEEKKEKTPVRMTRSFIERMATPKRPSPDKKESPVKETTPVRVIKRNVIVEAPVASSPHKAKPTKQEKPKGLPESPSKSALKSSLKDTKSKDDSSETRSDSPKSISPAPSGTPPARGTPTIQVEEVKAAETQGFDEVDSPDISFEEPKFEPSPSQPTVTFAEPELTKSPPRSKPESKAEVKQVSPEPKAKTESKSTTKTDKEREMEEYKAKLAEKRRLAREKAEREAEIERLRKEEEQRKEEERQQEEEERQRREEEEALRLAAQARKAEEERLEKAIEAEEKRKREEAERLEQEKIAKEEAEKKAKEEADRLEKERQERAKREEEERVERKKRLEMIMKRVKTGDSPATVGEKRNESPTRVVTSSSSRTSLVSSEDEKGEDSEKDEASEGLKPESEDTPKFKSPLLQKLTETRQNGDSGTPKFKSPLLQSIMGKTKLGARLSGTKLDELSKSDENLSKSDENLSEMNKAAESEQTVSEEKDEDGISNGLTMSSIDKCETEDNLLKEDDLRSRSDVDSHEMGESVIEGSDKPSFSVDGVTDSQLTVGSTADSAVSLSFNGVSSQNGDVHIEPRELIDSKELIDSSISMRTADSFGSSQTGSMGGSLVESQTVATPDSSQFEEIIDLNVTNKTLKTQQITDNLLNHAEDVLNLNNIDTIDNSHMTAEGDAASHPVGKPFIAFEDNATRRQDVPDLLS